MDLILILHVLTAYWQALEAAQKKKRRINLYMVNVYSPAI